jgi:hypothetical protein
MSVPAILMGAGLALTLTLLAGLGARGRFRLCWTFGPYLATAAIADLLMTVWPDQFHTQLFWLGQALVIDGLRFALALELSYRTVRAFPTALSTVRGVLLGVLLLTLWMVFSAIGDLASPEGTPILEPLISRVEPLVLSGSIWLLTGIALVILWYRLPVHPLHKAILVGLVPYLLLFTVSLNMIEGWGWEASELMNLFAGLVWLAVLGFWAMVAWRPGEVSVQAPAPDPGLHQATG